jgi:hypothetical protein
MSGVRDMLEALFTRECSRLKMLCNIAACWSHRFISPSAFPVKAHDISQAHPRPDLSPWGAYPPPTWPDKPLTASSGSGRRAGHWATDRLQVRDDGGAGHDVPLARRP